MLTQTDLSQRIDMDDVNKQSQQSTRTKLTSSQSLSPQQNQTNPNPLYMTHQQKIQATYNFQYLFRKKSNIYKMHKNKKNINNRNQKNDHLKNSNIEKEQKISKKGHWSTEQNKKYHWFLEIYNQHFILKHLRRTDKIFKTMSTFIGTRQAEQCRSHHQKMQKKYKNFYQIIIRLRMQFYHTCDTEVLKTDLEINGYLPLNNNQKQLCLIEQATLKSIQSDKHSIPEQNSYQQQNHQDIILRIERNYSSNQNDDSDDNNNEADLFFGQNYQNQLDYKLC